MMALNGRLPVIQLKNAHSAVLMLIVLFAPLLQMWGSLAVLSNVPPEAMLTDGSFYVTQARSLQCCASLTDYLQYGVYPAFLSLFDFRELTNWQAKNPALAQVYYTQ